MTFSSPSLRRDRSDRWAASLLERCGWPCLLGAGLLVWIPVWLGQTPATGIGVLLPIGALAIWLGSAEPAVTRLQWTGVLGLAFVIRLVTLIAGVYLGNRSGLDMLGPDGGLFYDTAVEMAKHPWEWPSPTALRNTDVLHYYLFSAVLHAFHANLFALRLMNAALDSLTAACAFSLCAMLWRSRASAAGVLAATYSPLVVISTLDLWKDPSAVLGIAMTLLLLFRAAQAASPSRAAVLAVGAGLALAYVRCTRAYWAFYLELAILGTAGLMLWWRVDWPRYRLAALAGALLLLVAELGPGLLGWPSSPMSFVNQFRHVTVTEEMRSRPKGSMDALITRATEAEVGERRAGAASPVAGPAPVARAEDLEVGPGVGRQVVAWALAAFRKIWGPYIWVMPPSLRPGDVLRGDYLLFPGTLVWYVLLPSIVLGIAATLTDAVRGRPASWPLSVIAGYLAIALAHYLVLHLSFRQRDGLFPLMMILGFAGWSRGRQFRWWRAAHVAYFVMLALLATAHLLRGPAPL